MPDRKVVQASAGCGIPFLRTCITVAQYIINSPMGHKQTLYNCFAIKKRVGYDRYVIRGVLTVST